MKFLHRATNTYIFAVGDSAQAYLKDCNYSLTADTDFKESDHPRDKSGKFGSGGGGSKGIEKHKPRFSTFDKPTSMPSTAGKITYKSPSTAEEKKFDNHKIYNGGEHTHNIGKQSVGSNEYIVKNIKSGEVKEFPNKESALKSVENPSQKSGSGSGGSSGNLHSDFEFKDRVTEAAKKNKFKTKSISTQTGVKTGFEADMSDLSSFVQEFTSDKKDPLFYTNFVSKIHEIAKESGFKQIHMNENGRSSIGFDFDHDDLEKFAKKIKSTKFN